MIAASDPTWSVNVMMRAACHKQIFIPTASHTVHSVARSNWRAMGLTRLWLQWRGEHPQRHRTYFGFRYLRWHQGSGKVNRSWWQWWWWCGFNTCNFDHWLESNVARTIDCLFSNPGFIVTDKKEINILMKKQPPFSLNNTPVWIIYIFLLCRNEKVSLNKPVPSYQEEDQEAAHMWLPLLWRL